jgi:hypothetical protein
MRSADRVAGSAPDELRALMQRHDLTRSMVAALLDVQTVTVDAWLAPPLAASHRHMPANLLRLLRLELREARPAGIPARPRPGPKPRTKGPKHKRPRAGASGPS